VADKADKEEIANAPRITQQFRDRGGMAYDFSLRGASFTVRVFARDSMADPDDWRVELHATRLEHVLVVSAWGRSRVEALRAAGRSWTLDPSSVDLPRPDWTAVEHALSTVRAV
jgi:hypothetical protein